MNVEVDQQIQIRFTVPSDNVIPQFSDALYYTSQPTNEQIQSDIQARYSNWLSLLANPPSPRLPPSDEDLLDQIDDSVEQNAQIIQQMSLEAQVDALTNITASVVDYASQLSDPMQASLMSNISDQIQALSP